MTFQTGAQLGPYEILSSLGSGGMGEVYRARDNRLGREVAVKVLPERFARDTAALDRFEREARSLAALSHPNILVLFDIGNENGIVFSVTELLEGRTLRERLDEGPLDPAHALQVSIGVSEGLSAAHSRGIIHRDLKPENIFLTTDDRVKILDFGLVRWNFPSNESPDTKLPTSAMATRTGTVMGTVNYMSPEQVRGVSVDERTDLFSMGIVMYEMLFGVRPFSAETLADTMVAILKDKPAVPIKTMAVPNDFLNVIQLCLEKEVARRLGSATELATALKQIAAGVSPSLSTRSRLLLRKPRRKRKIDSIAVMPFIDALSESGTEYLSDGITETIINILSQLPKLRVMARSTVFLYKGRQEDPRVIGRDLNVRAVLTGRLLKRDEQLNVQVELVDTEDGSQLWGEQYNQEICDLQNVHKEIATSISETLKIRLVGEEKKKLQKRYTDNVEAYRLYLQGRYHWNKRTEEGLRKGVELFEEAIDHDPEFALAYAGLADSYSVLAGFYFMPPSEGYPKAMETALKALSMDPDLAEAYTSLATVRERYEWNWKGAEKDFKKALKLNPGLALAHQWYGIFLVLMGRFRAGYAQIEKALELDPLSVAMHWTRAYVSYYMKEYDRSIGQFRRTLDMDPGFQRARYDMALAYLMSGQKEAALRTFEEWLPQRIDSPGTLPLLGYYFAVAGEKEKALEKIREVEGLQGKYISRFSVALIHLVLENREEALACLERSLENHEDAIASLKINPRLDPIRSEPRFQEMLRRAGFTD